MTLGKWTTEHVCWRAFFLTFGWRWFLLLVGLLCVSSAADGAERRAVFSSEELRARLNDYHARIHSWYFEYESNRQELPGNPVGSYLHRIVAAKSSGEFMHFSAHGTAFLDWRNDPLQQRMLVTGQQVVSEFPFNRSLRIAKLLPSSALPGTANSEFLFSALGWWPFEHRPPPVFHDLPYVLPAIANSPLYVVRPSMEELDGHWCHVLEYPRRDRLWLDCLRGCTLLAREADDPKTGVRLQRIELTRHRQVQPGIWVAMQIRNIQYDEIPDGSALDSTMTILDVRLNDDVTRTLFRFEPSPGSIQFTGKDSFRQTVPGGYDYMEHLVDWCKRSASFKDAKKATPIWDGVAMIGAFFAIGGAFAANGYLTRRGNWRTAQSPILLHHKRSDRP